MTKEQSILTLADLAARGCGENLFHRIACNEALGVALTGIDDRRAASARALAESLRRNEELQQRLWADITAIPERKESLNEFEVGTLFALGRYPELTSQYNSYLLHCHEADVAGDKVMTFEQFVRGLLAEREAEKGASTKPGISITGPLLPVSCTSAMVFSA